MNKVRLGYSILYVCDVALSIRFYTEIFGFEQKFIAPDNSYAELVSGETTLSFSNRDMVRNQLGLDFTENSLQTKPPAFELGFVTDDVMELYEKAASYGATLYKEPAQKPWGQTVAYIKDPDGFLLELCTPMS